MNLITKATRSTKLRSRAIGLSALTAVASLALAGCSPVSGGQSGSASGGGKTPPPTVRLVDSAPQLEAVTVDNLQGQRILHSSGSAARWAYVPNNDNFNRLVSEVVMTQLEAQAQTRGVNYSPEAHGTGAGLTERGCVSGSTFLPGEDILNNSALSPTGEGEVLSITCDPVLSAGDVFAERIRFVKGSAGTPSSDTATTIYTNMKSGQAAIETDLISDGGVSALFADLGHQLAESAALPGTTEPAATEELLEQLRASIKGVAFGTDSTVTLTVSSNFEQAYLEALAATIVPQSADSEDSSVDVAPQEELVLPQARTLYVQVPKELTETYLTDLGQSVSAAISDQTEWAGIAAQKPGERFVECSLIPCVALTFDDGPGSYTPQLLADLAGADSAATFYLLGQNVAAMPDIAKQIADSGNEIGNHSWSHPQLTVLSADEVASQINNTNDIILEASGTAATTYRPPYGAWNESVLTTANMPAILWSIDTNDWQKPGEASLLTQVIDGSYPGAIVLMHDIHAETVQAVPKMLNPLRERGFTLVTIDQLYSGGPDEPLVYYGLG